MEGVAHLLALSSDVYWERDVEHRFTRFSGADQATVEALRAGCFNLPRADWSVFNATLAERRPFRDLELGRVDEGGRVRWISVAGEPVLDAGGRFAGHRGLARDITAQKHDQALVALEHSIARALASAETSSAGLTAVIRAICELQGWLVGRFFSADEAAGVLRFAEGWAVAEPGAQQTLERSRGVVYRRGEGLSGHAWLTREALWVSDVATDPRASRHAGLWGYGIPARRGALVIPVDAGERTIGVLSFASTDRREPEERLLRSLKAIGVQVGQFLQHKLAEQALAESEMRFRETFELAGSGIAHVSLDGRFVRVNRRLCAILGYAEQELLGRSVKEISHAEDRDVTDAPRAQLRRGEVDRTSFEKRYLRKDGSVVWVNLTVALARGRDGAPQHEISIIEDISARKTAEREREVAEAALRESEARRARHLRRQERIGRFGQ
jgi:PAS domain S-box-containing protein